MKPTREQIEHRAIEIMMNGVNCCDCIYGEEACCPECSAGKMETALERAKKELLGETE